MTAGEQKLRIALAVFEPAGLLGPAAAALLGQGVPIARVGLIALATTAGHLISEGLGDGAASAPLAALLADLAPLLVARNATAIVASPGLIDTWMSGWRAPALWGNDNVADEVPRLAADLERQVRRGAAILAVASSTPAEQWLCMRILLQQASSPVLALECSLPAGH